MWRSCHSSTEEPPAKLIVLHPIILPGFLLFLATLFRFWKRIRRYAASSTEEQTLRDAALLSLVGVSITMIAENVIRDPRVFCLHLLFPALWLSAGAFTPLRLTND